jgi:hypothetical protein
VVKDNIDVEGVHTTNGYNKKASQIAKDNAAAVQRLIDEGAVILAKTNMSTGAKEAHWSKSQVAGETKNAYNIYYSPGGSSGGSSTAVALNFAAYAGLTALLRRQQAPFKVQAGFFAGAMLVPVLVLVLVPEQELALEPVLALQPELLLVFQLKCHQLLVRPK